MSSGLFFYVQVAAEFCISDWHRAMDVYFFSIAALIFALLTVSYQTIKAAAASPVDSLRYE